MGDQTLLDAEVGTDRSWLAATRWRLSPFDLSASYRARPVRNARDLAVTVGAALGRRVHVGAGWLRSRYASEDADWHTVSLRVPLGRWADLTLERAFSTSADTRSTTWAAMAAIAAGDLRVFQRYQWGRTDLAGPDLDAVVAREQSQSMASYTPGPRLSLTVQLATAWSDTGRAQHWQELQTLARLTPTTRLQLVTAVPDVTNADRLRAQFTQDLPGRFAVQAEFGRVSAYQSLRPGADVPRARVMVTRSWDLATPARGGVVTGRVLDHAGHAVAGVRVTLGPYAVRTGPDGTYVFKPLPAGRVALGLDPEYLPANYAWDGNGRTFEIGSSTREYADLGVTPLNAIHGRVSVDRNGNGRFDDGEGVPGAVLRLGDRVTASAADGTYAFYNVWPGDYAVVLDRLPAGVGPGAVTATPVRLTDDGPVTGADFVARAVDKPIIWKKVSR